MAVVLVPVGLFLVAVVVRDVIHELYHPAGAGTLSRALRRWTWWMFRKIASRDPDRLRLAGPATLLVVFTAWLALAVVGWAMVFVSFMPDSFRYASALTPAAEAGFGTALYLSLTALGTIGFGDITPTALPLRFAVTLEGLLGFLMLTAGISWGLALKPVLAERRTLAAAIHALFDTARETGTPLASLPPDDLRPALISLAEQITMARSRLLQSPETYYFPAAPGDASLAAVLPPLLDVVRQLEERSEVGIRYYALWLRHALGEFADVLSDQFIGHREGTAAVLEAYAADHLREAADSRG